MGQHQAVMRQTLTKQQAKRTRDENAKAMQAKQLEKLNAAYERATGR